ncbi:MAG: type II toxin-antitoxin system RelE/ParE family toxin [Tepidisphaeraceae bacterium]
MPKVVLSTEARKQLDALPMHLNAQVQKIVERLAEWPRVSGAKPLRGLLKGRYRIRMGDHRVQFIVAADVVTIEKIGKRDRFYD